jgi:hypothetical protein
MFANFKMYLINNNLRKYRNGSDMAALAIALLIVCIFQVITFKRAIKKYQATLNRELALLKATESFLKQLAIIIDPIERNSKVKFEREIVHGILHEFAERIEEISAE